MSKPYIPTFEIIVRRSFDGKIEGERSWKLSAAGSYVDKLEDTIAFVADAAMDAYGMRTAAASSAETVALCPHGMPLAENVCGPCSEGRPNTVTRTVWTKNSESDPYCVHCGKTWDMHLCDGFSSCPTAKTPLELSPSEAASFDKALARSPRRVSETPADLVGALQDRAHIDAGPFRPARSVKEAEPARPCYASGVAGICRLPAGHDGTHAFG